MVGHVALVGLERAWLHLCFDCRQPLLLTPIAQGQLRWLAVGAFVQVADDLAASDFGFLAGAEATVPFSDGVCCLRLVRGRRRRTSSRLLCRSWWCGRVCEYVLALRRLTICSCNAKPVEKHWYRNDDSLAETT